MLAGSVCSSSRRRPLHDLLYSAFPYLHSLLYSVGGPRKPRLRVNQPSHGLSRACEAGTTQQERHLPAMLQHKRTWSVIASLVALALVMLACGGGGNSGSADNGSSSPAASSQHFKVGQQVKIGDTFDVTVNSVTKNAGSDLDQPGSGNVYLIVDVTLKNI